MTSDHERALTPETLAELEGPECETCGKATCPDADLPGFSAPRQCTYAPIYEALRYDRCEYGCGRDITNDTIRRDIVPTVDAITDTLRNERDAALAEVAALRERTRGVRFRIEAACDGYAGLLEDDVPESVNEPFDYIKGAREAALNIRAALDVDTTALAADPVEAADTGAEEDER